MNMLDTMPTEISFKIAENLSKGDLISLSCVSRKWKKIATSGKIWERLFKEKFPDQYKLRTHLHSSAVFSDWKRLYQTQMLIKNSQKFLQDVRLAYWVEVDEELNDLATGVIATTAPVWIWFAFPAFVGSVLFEKITRLCNNHFSGD